MSELRVVYVADGEGEVGVIEKIEEARPDGKLGAFPLGQSETFFDANIGVEVSRTVELIAALIAKTTERIGKIRRAVARVVHAIDNFGSRGTAIRVLVAGDHGQGAGTGGRCAAAPE